MVGKEQTDAISVHPHTWQLGGLPLEGFATSGFRAVLHGNGFVWSCAFLGKEAIIQRAKCALPVIFVWNASDNVEVGTHLMLWWLLTLLSLSIWFTRTPTCCILNSNDKVHILIYVSLCWVVTSLLCPAFSLVGLLYLWTWISTCGRAWLVRTLSLRLRSVDCHHPGLNAY